MTAYIQKLLDWRKVDWANIALDMALAFFFTSFYHLIETMVVDQLHFLYWYTEPLQLYLFALMVAYTFWRQPGFSRISSDKASQYLPKVGYAFMGLGGFWLIFYASVLKKSDTWAFVLFFFLHLITSALAVLAGVRLANFLGTHKVSRPLVHVAINVQLIIGLMVLEIIFASVAQAFSEQTKAGAAGLVVGLWGLACFLPLRIFLMVSPPFHPLEVITATVSYVALLRAAIS